MAMQTNLILGIPYNVPGFYCFIFGATIVQYNLHYLTKTSAATNSSRLAWSLRNKNIHFYLLAIGTLFIIYSFFSFHLRHLFILLCLGAIAFLYSFPVIPFGKKNRLKEYGKLKIVTLSLLWTLVTVWFPANNFDYDPAMFWFVFAKRFVFMFVLCLLFDMRDVGIDRQNNIYTFPVKYGHKKSYFLAYFSLVFFVLLSFLQYLYQPQLFFFIPMIISAIATLAVIELTKKESSDYIYLAGIDGMMILQAMLTGLFTLKL